MNLLRFPLVWLVAMLAIGNSTSTGQTNGPVPQNVRRAASGSNVRPGKAHPNNPQYPYRGPANIGQRPIGPAPNQIQNQPRNFLGNYSRSNREVNPAVAAMEIPHPRPYSSQSNGEVTSRREIAQTAPPVMDSEAAAKTDDPQRTMGLPKPAISEGLETIDAQTVAKNDSVEPTARDLANGQVRQHKARLKGETGKSHSTYSDALRRNWHEWHNRDWWKQHCNTIVFVTGGYYFLDAGYWYPAWGYDPYNSYYDYDGPIYTYGNLLPDQVIANVQGALQEAGYYFGAINGSLSVETRTALINYQRDQGLLVSGAIDEPTVETLGLY
jgi:hypothetical protein